MNRFYEPIFFYENDLVTEILYVAVAVALGFSGIIKRPAFDDYNADYLDQKANAKKDWWEQEYIDPTNRWDGHEYRSYGDEL